MITIASLFKDSVWWNGHHIDQVTRFFRQIDSQQCVGKVDRVVCVEGSSCDDTYEQLLSHKDKHSYIVDVIKDEQQSHRICSVRDEARIVSLARVGNLALSHIGQPEFLFWIESDLIVDSLCISQLLEGMAQGIGAISPMILLETKRNRFYDTYSFVGEDGKNWTQHPRQFTTRHVAMKSVGSCALIRGDLIWKHGASFGNRCFPGLCDSIRNLGQKILVDTKTTIYHPSQIGNVKFRWI